MVNKVHWLDFDSFPFLLFYVKLLLIYLDSNNCNEYLRLWRLPYNSYADCLFLEIWRYHDSVPPLINWQILQLICASSRWLTPEKLPTRLSYENYNLRYIINKQEYWKGKSSYQTLFRTRSSLLIVSYWASKQWKSLIFWSSLTFKSIYKEIFAYVRHQLQQINCTNKTYFGNKKTKNVILWLYNYIIYISVNIHLLSNYDVLTNSNNPCLHF